MYCTLRFISCGCSTGLHGMNAVGIIINALFFSSILDRSSRSSEANFSLHRFFEHFGQRHINQPRHAGEMRGAASESKRSVPNALETSSNFERSRRRGFFSWVGQRLFLEFRGAGDCQNRNRAAGTEASLNRLLLRDIGSLVAPVSVYLNHLPVSPCTDVPFTLNSPKFP